MKRTISTLALGLLVAGAACGKSNNKADSALSTDLSLAAQQRGYQPLDSLSAAERAAAAPKALSGTAAPAPVRTATRSTSSGTTRRRTSGGGTSSSSGGTVSAPAPAEPREVTVKHTQRDAAIGAAAGAIIGATTSRNKVKGGVIGAAVGGILGGVIGNNVDKTKKKVP